MNYEMNLAHELDISWLIAVWYAMHGGDPNPDGGELEVSAETYALANGLVENLLATYGRRGARALPEAELVARLRKMGLQLVSDTARPEAENEPALPGGGEVVSATASCWLVTPTQKRCWKPFW